jgi:carbamoylphosphate synthase large subunit
MKDLNGKRLLLLGGSMWKEAISTFAKDNGIVLIATGNDPSAGIFEIADECYDIDSTDADGMKKLIIEKNIDGVYMGGSEPVISVACEYINELNLPCYCTKEQWDHLQNKKHFKKLCIEHGLPVVPQYEINIDEITQELDCLDFPVITKPADGCGSNGFSVCNNWNDLLSGYQKAKSNSLSGNVLVEKFVNNESIVVFYTFSDGKMYFSGIEDKYPIKYEKHGSYVAGMHIFESRCKNEFRQKFENKLKEMFSHLQIREGSLWIEVFFDGKNYYFNEAGYRYSGSVSIYPIDYYYQINQVAVDIYYSLTGKSQINGFRSLIDNLVPRKKYYCIYSIHLKEGKIKDVQGIPEVLQLNNVIAFPTTKKINDVVVSTGTVSQVFAFLHFVFDSNEEFSTTIRKMNDNIRIVDENGCNIIANMLNKAHFNRNLDRIV